MTHETTQCTSRHPFFGQCANSGKPFVAMCVHEHHRDGFLCEMHSEGAELDRAICGICVDLPGGLSHPCDLDFKAVDA